MAFDTLGMGFLGPDPRKRRGPTGGSYKASQYKDTSGIITGNPRDSVGFASPKAQGEGLFPTPYVAPPLNPNRMALTAAERTAKKESRGVATTGENMGSLAVGFRESEATKRAAGETTLTEQRAKKIVDAREADEYKRTILDPAAYELSKFRTQAANARELFHSSMDTTRGKLAGAVTRTTSGLRGMRDTVRSNRGSSIVNIPGIKLERANPQPAPDHSKWLDYFKTDMAANKENPDMTALRSTYAHSKAPGTQAKSWEDIANAQSAGGRATPIEMAQAAFSKSQRENPNR